MSIVIGAGHNGLVCAGELASAGYKVTVLEAADQPGGLCATREFAPGCSVSSPAHLMVQMDPALAADFHLSQHGLKYAARDLATMALSEDGAVRKIEGALVSGDGLSGEDVANYADWYAQMLRYAKTLARVAAERPPTLIGGEREDLITLLKLGWQIKKLGRADMRELLRVGSMNIFDALNERLADPLLKGALSMDGVLGSHTGPRSPNTVLAYLHRRLGDAAGVGVSIPAGGMGAVTRALAQSVAARGVTIRTAAEVTRIVVESDRAVGVELASGERMIASVIVSNADPKTTLAGLVGYPNINTGLARRVHNHRAKGTAAKLHLALSGAPEFKGVGSRELGARLVVAPDMGYVERAFDHVKYGEHSAAPVMEISVPTVHDPSLAPSGHHVLSAIVQYVPEALKSGDWSTAREPFTDIAVDLLERYAPGIRAQIVHRELITPADTAAQHRLSGGHWHHGELSLDQFMMMRPFPGAAQYKTPVAGLYLCGAGTHPGGGVMGYAGRNAARAIASIEKG